MPHRQRQFRTVLLVTVMGVIAASSLLLLSGVHGHRHTSPAVVTDVWDSLAAVESSSFDYVSARKWGQSYPQCNGVAQSPIDVATSSTGRSELYSNVYVHAHMRKGNNSLRMRHNTHGLEMILAKHQTDLFLSATREGHEASLVGLHFHHPSEHTIDGRHRDLEVHFVHLNEMTLRVTVVAILFEARDDAPHSQWLDNLFGGSDPLPAWPNAGSKLVQFDSIFPVDNISTLRFVRYGGSLTTPPCSPAEWIVATTVLPISRALFARYPKTRLNNRPIQPTQNRVMTDVRLIE